MILRDLPHMNAIYFQSHFAVIFKDVGSGKSTGVRKHVLGRMLDTSLLLPSIRMGEETRVGFHTSLAEETDICLRTVFLTLDSSQECFLIQKKKCASAKKYEIKIQAY